MQDRESHASEIPSINRYGCLIPTLQVLPITKASHCRLLGQLKPGDLLELRREPGNICDQRAIEIYWNQHMLGCILEIADMEVLQMVDRGEKLSASIASVDAGKLPWRVVDVGIYWGEPGLRGCKC